MNKKEQFHRMIFWTSTALLFTSILMACIYPFKDGDMQVVCRAYPSNYDLWQYAPIEQVTPEHRWCSNCNEVSGFSVAFASAWNIFNEDTIRFCVECQTLGDLCPSYDTCP